MAMNPEERQVFADLAEAYRILRDAYYHDMHREPPATNDLQRRVQRVQAADAKARAGARATRVPKGWAEVEA